MKNLIIYAHPNPSSLNHFLKESLVKHLAAHNQEVIVRDLNGLGFDPVLSLDDMIGQRKGEVAEDVKTEQSYITWADQITFIYPIWWTGLPAIMKGYIDRVMSYGFAYRYTKGVQEGLMKGKQVIIINTHGKSHSEYHESGMSQALILTSDLGIFTYCGFQVKRHFLFEKADSVKPETVKLWIKAVLGEY